MGEPTIKKFQWCTSVETVTRLFGFIILVLSTAFLSHNLTALIRERYPELAIFALILGLSVGGVNLLLAIILLAATYMRSRRGLRAWVRLVGAASAALVGAFASMQATLVGGVVNTYLSPSVQPMFQYCLLVELLFIGILAYCTVCVNGYYMMLTSEEDDKAVQQVTPLYPNLSLLSQDRNNSS